MRTKLETDLSEYKGRVEELLKEQEQAKQEVSPKLNVK